ncbi:hypothetical protein OED01_13015 [Microbacterium sp. M28]|uniref:hypothetical protein n=1 Tax=Microbacterium sp. M28 TaxID=2962064 RepID=UPI0021F41314|nr:hypothetical protein [Microbacterium sp. M28]UYO96516.1 hypothetical protein OED01_13015 [Microbacterium sp. M28]
MRILSFVLGGVLLLAGAGAVVLADQQRQDAVDQARTQLEDAGARLDSARAANRELAEELAPLRLAVAELEERLADTEGFLE